MFLKSCLCISILISTSVLACEPVRDSSMSDPMANYTKYINSNANCNVKPDALPYILRANEDVPRRGTLVLVHGLGGNPLHLHQMAEIFQKRGYNVVVPLLQGHGGDDHLLATSKLENWQKDVRYAGDIAEKMGGPVFIGGHSTGGLLAAIEAAEKKGRYSSVFAMDPPLNLQGSSVKWACTVSNVATFESDLAVRWLPGALHMSFDEQIAHVKKITDKLVEEQCGKGFPMPSYNYHYTLPGVCALSQAVEKFKKIPSRQLPPTLVEKSQDPDFYKSTVSAQELVDYLDPVNTNHRVVQTNAKSHELMPANCSEGFKGNVEQAINWFNETSRSTVVEVPSGTTTQ